MVYKKASMVSVRNIIFCIVAVCFCSCDGKTKTNNRYHIELINFNDRLKNIVSTGITGKASFYNNNKLEIISSNFITEDYPDIHYYEYINKRNSIKEPGSIKNLREYAQNDYADQIIKTFVKYTYE